MTTQERIKAVYQKIAELSAVVDPDTLIYSPKEINDLTAQETAEVLLALEADGKDVTADEMAGSYSLRFRINGVYVCGSSAYGAIIELRRNVKDELRSLITPAA